MVCKYQGLEIIGSYIKSYLPHIFRDGLFFLLYAIQLQVLYLDSCSLNYYLYIMRELSRLIILTWMSGCHSAICQKFFFLIKLFDNFVKNVPCVDAYTSGRSNFLQEVCLYLLSYLPFSLSFVPSHRQELLAGNISLLTQDLPSLFTLVDIC